MEVQNGLEHGTWRAHWMMYIKLLICGKIVIDCENISVSHSGINNIKNSTSCGITL